MSELLAVGYLLVRPLERTSFWSAELIPRWITSASSCLCPRFPGPYAIEWSSSSEEVRSAAFAKLGVPAALQPAARAWATESFEKEFGWPSVFYSPNAAWNAKRIFVSEEVDARVIGVGLSADALDRFLANAAPPPGVEGYAPMGKSGPFAMGSRREPLVPGGRTLGFEPMNVERGEPSHSWLCNSLETYAFEKLGIRPNADGLIETLEDAQRCCDSIARAEVGAEPGPWLPFALVEYPAAPSSPT
jgi:hypothetical protein